MGPGGGDGRGVQVKGANTILQISKKENRRREKKKELLGDP